MSEVKYPILLTEEQWRSGKVFLTLIIWFLIILGISSFIYGAPAMKDDNFSIQTAWPFILGILSIIGAVLSGTAKSRLADSYTDYLRDYKLSVAGITANANEARIAQKRHLEQIEALKSGKLDPASEELQPEIAMANFFADPLAAITSFGVQLVATTLTDAIKEASAFQEKLATLKREDPEGYRRMIAEYAPLAESYVKEQGRLVEIYQTDMDIARARKRHADAISAGQHRPPPVDSEEKPPVDIHELFMNKALALAKIETELKMKYPNDPNMVNDLMEQATTMIFEGER